MTFVTFDFQECLSKSLSSVPISSRSSDKKEIPLIPNLPRIAERTSYKTPRSIETKSGVIRHRQSVNLTRKPTFRWFHRYASLIGR